MRLEIVAAIVILALIGIIVFARTKTGKRLRLRASGTAAEAITKDASTPEGAKAYYNVAIEKKRR